MKENLNITLIQPDPAWEDAATNLARLEPSIRGLAPGAELVVLPEMFSTGFSMRPEALAQKMDGITVQWMKRLSAEKRIILTGSVIIEEDGKFYNRLLWVLPDGQVGIYDKKHLFAFAGEHEHYSAGNKRLVASVKGWKVNLLVCYDLRFPVWSRQQVQQEAEYDVLVCVANWPERRNVAWKTLLRARAIENQCYVIGVNRVGTDGNGIAHSGDSMAIDPLGEILCEKAFEETIMTVTLDKETILSTRKKLPFLDDADPFMLLS